MAETEQQQQQATPEELEQMARVNAYAVNIVHTLESFSVPQRLQVLAVAKALSLLSVSFTTEEGLEQVLKYVVEACRVDWKHARTLDAMAETPAAEK